MASTSITLSMRVDGQTEGLAKVIQALESVGGLQIDDRLTECTLVELVFRYITSNRDRLAEAVESGAWQMILDDEGLSIGLTDYVRSSIPAHSGILPAMLDLVDAGTILPMMTAKQVAHLYIWSADSWNRNVRRHYLDDHSYELDRGLTTEIVLTADHRCRSLLACGKDPLPVIQALINFGGDKAESEAMDVMEQVAKEHDAMISDQLEQYSACFYKICYYQEQSRGVVLQRCFKYAQEAYVVMALADRLGISHGCLWRALTRSMRPMIVLEHINDLCRISQHWNSAEYPMVDTVVYSALRHLTAQEVLENTGALRNLRCFCTAKRTGHMGKYHRTTRVFRSLCTADSFSGRPAATSEAIGKLWDRLSESYDQRGPSPAGLGEFARIAVINSLTKHGVDVRSGKLMDDLWRGLSKHDYCYGVRWPDFVYAYDHLREDVRPDLLTAIAAYNPASGKLVELLLRRGALVAPAKA